jgi:hypothetical protein
MYDKLDQLAKLDGLYQVQRAGSAVNTSSGGRPSPGSHPVAQVEMTAVGASGTHGTVPLSSPVASNGARVVRMRVPSSDAAAHTG